MRYTGDLSDTLSLQKEIDQKYSSAFKNRSIQEYLEADTPFMHPSLFGQYVREMDVLFSLLRKKN